jgi:hypothetical protein
MANDNFADDVHALVGGMLWGLLMRHGVDVSPVRDEDGDYTPQYEIKDESFPGGRVILTLENPSAD